MKLVPHDHIEMLGVPLGSPEWNSNYVKGDLLLRLEGAVDLLTEFEDSQAAFFLLRVSYSIVRAVHFMRTTPLEHWRAHAQRFDDMMRKAVEVIIGSPMPEHSYKQSCLTPKLGVGMRQVEVHADTAFNASWHEARATSKEEGWTPPAGVTIEYTPQAVASYKIDEQILLQMVEERKGDPREPNASSSAPSPTREGS